MNPRHQKGTHWVIFFDISEKRNHLVILPTSVKNEHTGSPSFRHEKGTHWVIFSTSEKNPLGHFFQKELLRRSLPRRHLKQKIKYRFYKIMKVNHAAY